MLLGLAGNLLKSLGGKKKKISGEEMAQNVMNESKDKSQNPTTVFHEKKSIVKGADIKPLTDIRDDMKASSKKSKDPLNLALDGIDNSLFGIIDTLTKTNLSRKKGRILFLKQEQQKKKTLRERMLEGASGFVKGAVGTVQGLTGSTWDKLMQFFTWTFVGAIVNAIIKNWEEIQLQIKKVVSDLTKLYEGLEPILTPIANWVKWIVGEGLGWTAKIDAKQKEMDHEGDYNEIMKQLKLQHVWKKDFEKDMDELDEMMKELRNAKSREEVQEIVEKYKNKIEGDREPVEPTNLTNEKGEIDPITNIVDDETGEKLRISETFDDGDAPLIGPNDDQERIDTYYVDQNGKVRLKEDNSRPIGSRFINKDGLERRQYPPVEEKSSNLNFSSAMDIESHYVGLEAYSDEDFNTQSSIILFSQENETDMNYLGSNYNFDIDSNNFYNKSLNTKDALYYWKLENN